MKHIAFAALIAVITIPVTAPVANAGTKIERACMVANRRAATRSLCGCIQNVADRELSRREQRMAAKFFKDPHLAQETRQSDNPAKEAFWKRYKAFGATAKASCG